MDAFIKFSLAVFILSCALFVIMEGAARSWATRNHVDDDEGETKLPQEGVERKVFPRDPS